MYLPKEWQREKLDDFILIQLSKEMPRKGAEAPQKRENKEKINKPLTSRHPFYWALNINRNGGHFSHKYRNLRMGLRVDQGERALTMKVSQT